jgi:hypothetical protein
MNNKERLRLLSEKVGKIFQKTNSEQCPKCSEQCCKNCEGMLGYFNREGDEEPLIDASPRAIRKATNLYIKLKKKNHFGID